MLNKQNNKEKIKMAIKREKIEQQELEKIEQVYPIGEKQRILSPELKQVLNNPENKNHYAKSLFSSLQLFSIDSRLIWDNVPVKVTGINLDLWETGGKLSVSLKRLSPDRFPKKNSYYNFTFDVIADFVLFNTDPDEICHHLYPKIIEDSYNTVLEKDEESEMS